MSLTMDIRPGRWARSCPADGDSFDYCSALGMGDFITRRWGVDSNDNNYLLNINVTNDTSGLIASFDAPYPNGTVYGPNGEEETIGYVSSSTIGGQTTLRYEPLVAGDFNIIGAWTVEIQGLNVTLVTGDSCVVNFNQAFDGGVTNEAPEITSATITGTASEGSTYTANYTYSDAESDAQNTSSTIASIEWYRYDAETGTAGETLLASGALTYTLVAADANKYIGYKITPHAAFGTTPGDEVDSTRKAAQTAPIADSVTMTPIGLWSMNRKLKDTATAAFRLREDGGDTETDIGFSGLAIDTAAITSHLSGANGYIVKIYGQNGDSDWDLVQTGDATKQAALTLDGTSGLYVAEFDGTNDAYKTNGTDVVAQPIQYFFVAESTETDSTAQNIVFSSHTSATDRHIFYAPVGSAQPDFGIYAQGAATLSTTGTSYAQFDLTQVTILVDEADSEIRVEGTKKSGSANATTPGTADMEGLALGALHGGAFNPFQGYFHELIMCEELSTSDRDTVEDSQMDHVGIS